MRAWQLLACFALTQFAVSAAFSLQGYVDEESGDLVAAASDHGHGHSSSSGFEESGGEEFGEDHHSKVEETL